MKTTKKDFQEFKAECERLIDLFGFMDWDIYYCHKELNSDASLSFVQSHRTCTFNLSTNVNDDWDGCINCAMHEVGHLLSAELYDMAANYHSKEALSPIYESIANRIMNALNKLSKTKGEK